MLNQLANIQKKTKSVDLVNHSWGNVWMEKPIQVVGESQEKGVGEREPFGLV